MQTQLKPLILAVDDDKRVRNLIKLYLSKSAYEVAFANDGLDALEKLKKIKPDLILLDAMMPNRDGFDVCQTIRANPEWAGVHIIMLTAKGRDIEREKGLAMGADDYITKPFSTKEVMAHVEKILGPGDKNE